MDNFPGQSKKSLLVSSQYSVFRGFLFSWIIMSSVLFRLISRVNGKTFLNLLTAGASVGGFATMLYMSRHQILREKKLDSEAEVDREVSAKNWQLIYKELERKESVVSTVPDNADKSI